MNLNNTNTLKNLKFRRIFFFYLIKQTNLKIKKFKDFHFQFEIKSNI